MHFLIFRLYIARKQHFLCPAPETQIPASERFIHYWDANRKMTPIAIHRKNRRKMTAHAGEASILRVIRATAYAIRV